MLNNQNSQDDAHLIVAGNLFGDIPGHLVEERTEVLSDSQHTRIERIVSTGHQSPDGSWYDQEEDEWVALLSGSATIQFDDDAADVRLVPGDWLTIPAHRRHRVASTSQNEPTVWLTVFSSVDGERND